MEVTPITYFKLVRFDVTKEHQLTFSNLQTQKTFFDDLTGIELENATYQRKDSIIRYAGKFDSLQQYNYCFYENEELGKRYYCYIEDLSYINEGMTEIKIKTDVFQTWQFDFIYKQMFVEREHVNSDIVGEHTIPEGLETGEYVVNSQDYVQELTENYGIMIQTTEYINSTSENKPLATNFGGIYMAGGAYYVPDILTAVTILRALQTEQGTSVYNVYVTPSAITRNQWEGESPSYQFNQNYPYIITKTLQKPSSVNGYVPVNKKLLTFPFNYLLISNNSGTSNVLHYEEFLNQTISFNISGVPVVGCSIKMTPEDYQFHGFNEENGIMCGKFPTLNWSQDNYLNWLRQNALNLNIGIAGGFLQMLAGGFMSSPEGFFEAEVSGLSKIFSTMKQNYLHQLEPNSARGNVNAGDINYCQDMNTFYFYQMSIKSEYARKIDKYFSMFGYKVNERKLPNINGRRNWNFVKTEESIVESNVVPEKDLNEFKNMLNNGITFWHNYSTFLDYSQTNDIL